ncbi:hypothetical protein [Sulfitobacter sp.]|uniref:hypothetical protein n=1 Tax=Sulfitobacter sp. TaxID=1903071 RepID=UPI00272A23C7|nr:hypothetical protein [Sulfitobacter sp.]
MVDLEQLADDLTDTLVWCEHKHPHAKPLTLFAATQYSDAPKLLAVAVVDTQRPVATKLDGPIVEDARRCLVALGYSFAWQAGGNIHSVTEVRTWPRSAHEQLAVIRKFQELGL